MSLPTKDQLASMDFILNGEPFLGNLKYPVINTWTMDFLLLGEPYVTTQPNPQKATFIYSEWGE